MRIALKRFQDWSLNQKFMLILLVLLIGFSFIGFGYNAVLNVEKRAAVDVEQVNKFGSLVDSFQIKVLGARASQNDFLSSSRLEDLEAYDNKLNESIAYANQLGGNLVSQEEQSLLNRMTDVLSGYQNNFFSAAEMQVALGLDENSGIYGELREAAHKLEEMLRDAGDSRLLALHLDMRRYEKDYLARKAEKYVQSMADADRAFAALVSKSKLSDDQRQTFIEANAAYHIIFAEVVSAIRKQAKDLTESTALVEALDPILTSLLNLRDSRLTSVRTAASEQRNTVTLIFTGVIVLIAVAVLGILLVLGRGISRPIAHLQDVVSRLTEGDYQARTGLKSSDEVGTLGKALDRLLDERVATLAEAEKENEHLNNSIIALLEAVSRLSQRDLTVKVPVTEDITGPIADALNLLTSATANVLQNVTTTSSDVASASAMVKTQSDSVIKVADIERAEVERTVTDLTEAAEVMGRIAQLAKITNNAADKAIKNTVSALETVTSTVEGINDIRETIHETEKRIKRLGERSQEITGVVNLINEIAERTHILALNASMHAASAGEAGRGFAVVADEVQRLAENARDATSQITTLVNNIQVETGDTITAMNKAITQVVEGTRRAEEAGHRMMETQKTTTDLVASVQRIASSSQKQAQVSNELLLRANQIHESTLKTHDQLTEQAEQTNRLIGYAGALVESVRVFKLPEPEAVIHA